MKKYLPLLLIAAVILALNISEKNQPQNKLLISGIAAENGENDEFKFTFSIMEGEGEDLKFKFKSCESDNIVKAAVKISETEGKEQIFSMCRWLIVSRDIDSRKQTDIIDSFVENREVTPKLMLFEGDGKAIEYITENQLETEKIISLAQQPQTLPDYVNIGKIINILSVQPEGLKVTINS